MNKYILMLAAAGLIAAAPAYYAFQAHADDAAAPTVAEEAAADGEEGVVAPDDVAPAADAAPVEDTASPAESAE